MVKKVIVTGGAGFIGSHLVDKLIDKGYSVTVLDNFSTSRSDNLFHQELNNNLKVVKIDVSSLEGILPYFENIDYVFHLAGLADIVPSIVNPASYFRSNVDGSFNVAEAARLQGIKKLIYAASSSCYGIANVYPTPETAQIIPQYPYALTKYLGEQLILHWGIVYKLPVISLRLFNVYGPRSRTSGTYGAVFGVFLAQKLAGKPFTIVGDGKQTRDFTFVSDVVSAFLAAAESEYNNEVFNVGSGNTYSVNRLVELLKGPVTYIPKRPGEPDCTFADTTKIQKMLKWKPKVSFEEGVAALLKNINYWKNAPVWAPQSINEATKEWFQFLGKE